MRYSDLKDANEKLSAANRKLAESQGFLRKLVAAIVAEAGGEIIIETAKVDAIPPDAVILTPTDEDLRMHIKVKDD